MAKVTIKVAIEGNADLRRALDGDQGLRWEINKHENACAICVGNTNPYIVAPFGQVHPQCLPGSTRVSAATGMSGDVAPGFADDVALTTAVVGRERRFLAASAVAVPERDFGRRNIRAVAVREHVGDGITIRTSTGKELTGTPNHPVATRGGWVALSKLRVGDHVLGSTRPEWVVDAINPGVYDIPPTIEQVAKSFPVRLDPMPTAAEDFHGDGAGSEVHVVLTDGSLGDHGESLCSKHFRELYLGYGDVADRVQLSELSAFDEFGVTLLSTSGGGIGRRGETLPIFRAGLGHSSVHSIATAARSDSVVKERSAYRSPADSEGFCESLLAFSSDISAEEIINVRRHPLGGHVFNLSTADGWYIGNGIVTHNCRCVAVLVEE